MIFGLEYLDEVNLDPKRHHKVTVKGQEQGLLFKALC